MDIQPRAFSPSAPGWHRDLSGGTDSIAALLGPSTRSSVPAVLVRMVLSCPLVLCLLSSEIPCWDWFGTSELGLFISKEVWGSSV